MTVRELIKRLQDMPQDVPVAFEDEFGTMTDIAGVDRWSGMPDASVVLTEEECAL